MQDRVLRISQSDLEVADEKIKALMNDMVNAQTPGYQESEIVTRAFPLELQHAVDRLNARSSLGPMEPKIEGTFYNRIKGSLVKTGSKLDVALGGNGYFVLAGEMGEIYTRDGRFVLNKEGNLVSVSGGNLVLGEGGPIHLGQVDHKEITITADGYILVDAAQVAKLRVVKVGNPQELKAVSGSFYRGNEDQLDLSDDENPQAVQGYVETSNVSVIDQMMDLIYLNQKYSLATKVVQSYDENLAASMKMGELNQ